MPEPLLLLSLLAACSSPPAPTPPAETSPPPWSCDASRTRHCLDPVPAGDATLDVPTSAGPSGVVKVAAFYLQRNETPVAQFLACVAAGACRAEDADDPAVGKASTDAGDRPVVGLTWDGAVRLCAWTGGRLPTEAEWVRAAQGDDHRHFPWGDTASCGRVTTLPLPLSTCDARGVATYGELDGRGPFGHEGLGGNVWEWVSDGPVVDSRGRSLRVQRGGGWLATEPEDLAVSARVAVEPGRRLPDVGVRCARDAP